MPERLTGTVNTVVGQITVMTADQLPAPKINKLQLAQLMKDRMDWQSKIDTFTIEEVTEWNAHKEDLKKIPNMSRKEKIELFERLRRLASAYGIGYNEAARTFVLMPLPGDTAPVEID